VGAEAYTRSDPAEQNVGAADFAFGSEVGWMTIVRSIEQASDARRPLASCAVVERPPHEVPIA